VDERKVYKKRSYNGGEEAGMVFLYSVSDTVEPTLFSSM
jgi:hypothetical protein